MRIQLERRKINRHSYGGERRIQLEGSEMGYWNVLRYEGDGEYFCRCVCGEERAVAAASLLSKSSKSCGCMSSYHKIKNTLSEQEKKKKAVVETFEPSYS